MSQRLEPTNKLNQGWILLALVAVGLNIANIDWKVTPIWQGTLLVLVLGIIQGSVLELVVITVATLMHGKSKASDKKAQCDNATVLLNYNLLALSRDDIEETLRRMFNAYMGNLTPNMAAVLVSATSDTELKDYELRLRDSYRALIHVTLTREGECFAARNFSEIDQRRLTNVWKKFLHLDRRTFMGERLPGVVNAYVRDFMCVHRVSRVLKKCGQYQDLIQLSDGDDLAFTYTDQERYGSKARKLNERLFHRSADVDSIHGRKFHYTLVLDGDTQVPPGAAVELLGIAAAHPEAAIIQPAIVMDVNTNSDTVFMFLERVRQEINEPVTNAMTKVLKHSGFYGKALIKNTAYLQNVIGNREYPIERVPIDVLSHDTFEAAVLPTYFAGSVGLLEAPCFNYVTWNIRERRWNKGEVLLSIYFWETIIGRPLRALQKLVQGGDFVQTKLKTRSKMDFVSSYIAHSALRQMFMKPLLLVFILLHMNVQLKYSYYPIILMMFLIIVFPKFATCTLKNFKYVVVETIASILQFTPEAIVGTVRILKAYQANICICNNWTPQAAVEDEFKNSNPILSSLKHMWGYSLFALILAIIVGVFAPSNILLYFMLATVFILPIYTGVTSFTLRLKSPRAQYKIYRDNLSSSRESLGAISWSDYHGVSRSDA